MKNRDKNYGYSNISSLLKKSGYTSSDIEQFREKIKKEHEFYTGDILCTEFIEDTNFN